MSEEAPEAPDTNQGYTNIDSEVQDPLDREEGTQENLVNTNELQSVSADENVSQVDAKVLVNEELTQSQNSNQNIYTGSELPPPDYYPYNLPTRYNRRPRRRRGRPTLRSYAERYSPTSSNFTDGDSNADYFLIERENLNTRYSQGVLGEVSSAPNSEELSEGTVMVGKEKKGEKKKILEMMSMQFNSSNVSNNEGEGDTRRGRRSSRMGRPPKRKSYSMVEMSGTEDVSSIGLVESASLSPAITQTLKRIRKDKADDPSQEEELGTGEGGAETPAPPEDFSELTEQLTPKTKRKVGRGKKMMEVVPETPVERRGRYPRGARRGRGRARGRQGSSSPMVGTESPRSESSMESLPVGKQQSRRSGGEYPGRGRGSNSPQSSKGGSARKSRGRGPVLDRQQSSRRSTTPISNEMEQEMPPMVEEIRKRGRTSKRTAVEEEDDQEASLATVDTPVDSPADSTGSAAKAYKKKKKKHFKGLKYSFVKKKKKPKVKTSNTPSMQGVLMDAAQETESLASEDVDGDSFDSSSQDMSRRLLLLPGELDPYDPSVEFDDSHSEKSVPLSLQQQRIAFQRKEKEGSAAVTLNTSMEEEEEEEDMEETETGGGEVRPEEEDDEEVDYEEEWGDGDEQSSHQVQLEERIQVIEEEEEEEEEEDEEEEEEEEEEGTEETIPENEEEYGRIVEEPDTALQEDEEDDDGDVNYEVDEEEMQEEEAQEEAYEEQLEEMVEEEEEEEERPQTSNQREEQEEVGSASQEYNNQQFENYQQEEEEEEEEEEVGGVVEDREDDLYNPEEDLDRLQEDEDEDEDDEVEEEEESEAVAEDDEEEEEEGSGTAYQTEEEDEEEEEIQQVQQQRQEEEEEVEDDEGDDDDEDEEIEAVSNKKGEEEGEEEQEQRENSKLEEEEKGKMEEYEEEGRNMNMDQEEEEGRNMNMNEEEEEGRNTNMDEDEEEGRNMNMDEEEEEGRNTNIDEEEEEGRNINMEEEEGEEEDDMRKEDEVVEEELPEEGSPINETEVKEEKAYEEEEDEEEEKGDAPLMVNGDMTLEGEKKGGLKRSLEEDEDTMGVLDATRKSKRINRVGASHPLAIAAPTTAIGGAPKVENEGDDCKDTLKTVANPSMVNVLCHCRDKENPRAVNLSGDVYCQAIDSFDGRIIGCCNTLSNFRYLRVSGKIPFMLLCNIHRQRIRRHNCCPGCGLFCTQGVFMECRWDKLGWKHYYHKLCGLLINGVTLCPHCGTDQPATEVHLELKLIRKPIVYLKQHQEKKGFNSSARMSLTKTLMVEKTEDVIKKEDSETADLELPDGKIISPSKLPMSLDRDRLSAAITVIKMGKAFSIKAAPKGIYWSCKQGDLEKLLHLLMNGVSPNAKVKEYGNQCGLHTASTHGCLPAIHILVAAGASLDPIDSQLQTPLMIAISKGHNDIVNYLVQSGANLNVKTQDGMTCLHLAAKSGNYEACRHILDSGRLSRHAINIQDEGGWTPLVWASENRCINVVKILLDRGANPQICDVEQNTALHWAAFSGSTHICSMVLDRGCSLRSMNGIGDTPLHIAARQNHVEAVVLLLARGSMIDIQNAKGQTPLDCAFPESDVFLQLTLNKKLRSVMETNGVRNEKILSSDIAAGKEAVPIPIVNGADDEDLPKDYVYISENCEALNVNIDRTMNSIKWCECEDGCNTETCICSQLNFQCWYDPEGKLLPDFNYADPPMIFECNRACGCNKLSCHNRVVQHGMTSHLQLFKTVGKGWGVRALKTIEKGSYVCEYVGEIITDLEADLREDDSYLFDLDNRDSETFCIDARQYGNVARFINHLCEANLTPVKMFIDHQDLVFPRIAFFANRDIEADEELGFDYGEKFWVIKYKHFTCTCASPKCKYSSETIQSTLENYNKKVKEIRQQENPMENGGSLSH